MNASVKLKPPHVLKVIKIGNSLGVVLPKEVLARLGAEPGDLFDVIESSDGISFRRHEADFAKQMAAARDVMKRRRVALRELAK